MVFKCPKKFVWYSNMAFNVQMLPLLKLSRFPKSSGREIQLHYSVSRTPIRISIWNSDGRKMDYQFSRMSPEGVCTLSMCSEANGRHCTLVKPPTKSGLIRRDIYWMCSVRRSLETAIRIQVNSPGGSFWYLYCHQTDHCWVFHLWLDKNRHRHTVYAMQYIYQR